MTDNPLFREFNTDKEAEEWARTHYPDIISLDPESDVGQALHGYTGSWYKIINPFMRKWRSANGDEYDDEQKAITAIHTLLKSHATPENIIVYRYTYKKMLKILAKASSLKKGMCLIDQAFVSTTLRKELLRKFAKEHNCNCLLKIKVPQGSPGAYVSMEKIDTILNEQEFLLPPCTKFRIDKIHWFTYPMLIECSAIPYTKDQEGG